MIMFVHQEPNAHHKIICQSVNVQRVTLETRTLIVNQNHKLNVQWTQIVQRDWLALTTNASIHAQHLNHASNHRNVRSFHHYQLER